MIKSVLSNEAQGEGGVEGRVGLNVNKTKTDFGNSILNIECVICNVCFDMESSQEQSFTDITRTFLNNQDNLSSILGPSVCGTYLSVF